MPLTAEQIDTLYKTGKIREDQKKKLLGIATPDIDTDDTSIPDINLRNEHPTIELDAPAPEATDPNANITPDSEPTEEEEPEEEFQEDQIDKGQNDYFGNSKEGRINRLRERGATGAADFLDRSKAKAESKGHKWATGKYKGQKWSFDKAQDLASQDPRHFIGVYGNFDVWGDGWMKVDESVQKKVVARLIAEGLYYSEDGSVMIKDHDRAREIYEEEMQGQSEEEGSLDQNYRLAQELDRQRRGELM